MSINGGKKVEDKIMVLTRNFKETIQARVKADSKFARELVNEAITLFLNGDPETAKLILRDLVNATIGFEELALEINKNNKSLHRMLSKTGNPTMTSLSAIFSAILKNLHVDVKIRTMKHA